VQITASLIPHEEFHLGSWFVSVEKPCWYYFLKKRNTNRITNKHFMESVDEPLKELVNFLHQEGIRTTPSCSGHFRTQDVYEEIYDQLVQDREKIRGKGLELKDIETGKIIHYQNDSYELPWGEHEFLQKIMKYQHKGVLGMRLGHKRKIKNQILALKEPGTKILEREGVLLLLIDQGTSYENLATWARITQDIEEIFSQVLHYV
jgi:hypothetical protein